MPIMRYAAKTVACPKCGAQPGSRCVGKFGVRNANHSERVSEYKFRQAQMKYGEKKGGTQ